MNKIWALGFALLLGGSLFVGYAIPTWAEEQPMAEGTCALDTHFIVPEDVSGLIGALVLDQNREELGRVVGVEYSSDEDLTNFLIVSSCLPGMSERLVAIPYTTFFPVSIGTVTLGLSKDEFMNAPVYSGIIGEDWANQSLEYWQKTPYFG